MPKWLLKLAYGMVRDPEGSGHKILIAVLVIIGTFLLIGVISMNMIGAFFEEADLIDDDFDVATTEVYKNIDRLYGEFREDIQKKMDDREKEIIAENTTYIDVPVKDADGNAVVDEDGNAVTEKQAVCNVKVTKTFNNFSYSYILAYINHSTKVMELEKYNFDDKEIYSLMESICKIKEEHSGDNYYLFTVIKTPEQIAAELYPDDEQKQDMYVQSFELYEEFLAFVQDSTKYDTDAGNTNNPGHSTSLTDDDINNIVSNVPPDQDIAKQVLAFAASKVGYPYSQKKRDSGSYFDCSSLAYYAYKSAGVDASNNGAYSAAEIARNIVQNGTVVSVNNLQPGDLIFWKFKGGNGRFMEIEHVGIYAGNGMVIDASYSKGYVVHRPLYSKGNIVLCGRPYK